MRKWIEKVLRWVLPLEPPAERHRVLLLLKDELGCLVAEREDAVQRGDAARATELACQREVMEKEMDKLREKVEEDMRVLRAIALDASGSQRRREQLLKRSVRARAR